MTGSQAAGCRAGVAQDRVGPQHPLQETKQTANNVSDKLDLREPDWLPRTSTVVDSTVHSGHCLLPTLDQTPWNDLLVHSIGQRSHTADCGPGPNLILSGPRPTVYPAIYICDDYSVGGRISILTSAAFMALISAQPMAAAHTVSVCDTHTEKRPEEGYESDRRC